MKFDMSELEKMREAIYATGTEEVTSLMVGTKHGLISLYSDGTARHAQEDRVATEEERKEARERLRDIYRNENLGNPHTDGQLDRGQ